MPITADGALKNTIIVGKNQRKPIYKFTNTQLAMGSIKGTFNSNIISNELPIDTFSFNVNYDDEANAVYLTSDTNRAYVCAGYVPGTLEESRWVAYSGTLSAEVEGNKVTFGNGGSDLYFYPPRDEEHPDGLFVIGDELEISVTIESTDHYMDIEMGPLDSSNVCQSKTGVFVRRTGYTNRQTFRAESVGEDVLYYKWNYVRPTHNLSQSSLHLSCFGNAVITINGINFNGKMVYGAMRSDLPEGQSPALYILSNKDKTPASEYLRDIKYGTPVWWYCNHKFMAKGYYKGNTRTSRTNWKVDVMSAIGKLDEKIHVGGIYTGQTFKSVLTEICGNTCRFEFDEGDEALENLQVFGWLPYDTARNNLHRLLFAMGASIKKVNVT